MAVATFEEGEGSRRFYDVQSVVDTCTGTYESKCSRRLVIAEKADD
jgi:hypothetical protein